jgi:hypothetical protein
MELLLSLHTSRIVFEICKSTVALRNEKQGLQSWNQAVHMVDEIH